MGLYATIYVSDLRNAQNKYAAAAHTVVPFLANWIKNDTSFLNSKSLTPETDGLTYVYTFSLLHTHGGSLHLISVNTLGAFRGKEVLAGLFCSQSRTTHAALPSGHFMNLLYRRFHTDVVKLCYPARGGEDWVATEPCGFLTEYKLQSALTGKAP